MKRVISILAAGVLMLSLTACGITNKPQIGAEDVPLNEPTTIEREQEQPGLDLVIKESGWSTYYSSYIDETYITYGVIVYNPNDTSVALRSQIRITARDADNKVVGTSTDIMGMVWPQEAVGFGNDRLSVTGTVASVDFEVIMGDHDWGSVESYAPTTIKPLEIIDQSENTDEYSFSIIGEILNDNPLDVTSSSVTAIFRDDEDKIIGSAMGYVNVVAKDGGTAPFEIYVTYNKIPYSTIDLYAQIDDLKK
jgi:hypothetical protein